MWVARLTSAGVDGEESLRVVTDVVLKATVAHRVCVACLQQQQRYHNRINYQQQQQCDNIHINMSTSKQEERKQCDFQHVSKVTQFVDHDRKNIVTYRVTTNKKLALNSHVVRGVKTTDKPIG